MCRTDVSRRRERGTRRATPKAASLWMARRRPAIAANIYGILYTSFYIADSSQSLSPFEKTLCTFTRNARPPSAQLKSTQTRPAASVNCHLCSTMTCFGWPRWLRGRGPSPRDPIRAHQAVSAPAKNHGLFWRRHISSGVDQRWSLTPRATPSSRSDCAVYCRSSLMPSSP